MFVTLIFVLSMFMVSGIASADVESDWPMDKPNIIEYPSYRVINFEDGTSSYETVESPYDDVDFDMNSEWIYAKKNDRLNIHPQGAYIVNGDFGAWCGIDNDGGRINFDSGINHVSLLTSTYSGIEIDAYDKDGNLIANSGRSSSNTGTQTFDRLSIDSNALIYHIIVHDSGNYWLIDDLVFGKHVVPVEKEKPQNSLSSPAMGIGLRLPDGNVTKKGDKLPTLYTWKEKDDEFEHHTTFYFPAEGIYSGVVIVTPPQTAGEPIQETGYWDTAKGQRTVEWKANNN